MSNTTETPKTTPIAETGISPDCLEAITPFLKRCLTINHDLNNPLAGILGYAEFLLDEGDNLTADQKGQLEQILKCAERMNAIIEDFCAAKQELGEKIDLKALQDR